MDQSISGKLKSPAIKIGESAVQISLMIRFARGSNAIVSGSRIPGVGYIHAKDSKSTLVTRDS